MAVAHHVVQETAAPGLSMQSTSVLPHPVEKLLELICCQLVQGNAAQLRADVEPDKILIGSLRTGTEHWLAVVFIPEYHPLAEGHVRLDFGRGCRSHGIFQRFQFCHAVCLGLCQHIFCFVPYPFECCWLKK